MQMDTMKREVKSVLSKKSTQRTRKDILGVIEEYSSQGGYPVGDFMGCSRRRRKYDRQETHKYSRMSEDFQEDEVSFASRENSNYHRFSNETKRTVSFRPQKAADPLERILTDLEIKILGNFRTVPL